MIFLKVLEVVSPIFILAVLGMLWTKLGWEYPIKFVTRLSMMVAVPCLVFISLIKTEVNVENFILVTKAALATYFLIIIIFSCLIKLAKISLRTYLAPLSFGNTGNIGLPLAYFAFGEVGLGYAVIIFSITAILSFTIGIWFVSGGATSFQALKNEPLIIATILGTIFLINDWSIPVFMMSPIELIAQIAIPLMLLTLGVAVANLKSNSLNTAFGFSTLKFLVCVSSALLVGNFLPLDETALSVLLLQMSAPVAVTSYLLATKYEADAGTVAGLVIISTLISLLSLPTLLFIQLS